MTNEFIKLHITNPSFIRGSKSVFVLLNIANIGHVEPNEDGTASIICQTGKILNTFGKYEDVSFNILEACKNNNHDTRQADWQRPVKDGKAGN